MFRLSCKIVIRSNFSAKTIQFDYVNSIIISSSTKTFTDTAKIVIPRKLSHKGVSFTDMIRRNDEIEISLGYDMQLEKVFTGYITKVGTGTPLSIECENAAWNLKQIKIAPKHYPKLSIQDFVKEWMPSYSCKVAEVDLGEVIIKEESSLASVFEYFMKNYPLSFFFRDGVFYGVLTSAMTLSNEAVKTIKFKMGYNVISDNLVYTLQEDVKIQIVAKAILADNTKLEYKVPATGDGEIRTFFKPGAKSIDELKAFADEMLATYKVDKMSGDFTAFGIPYVRKGDIVHLFDEKFPERNDKKFVVESVEYNFGLAGYRQKINLGYELKNG